MPKDKNIEITLGISCGSCKYFSHDEYGLGVRHCAKHHTSVLEMEFCQLWEMSPTIDYLNVFRELQKRPHLQFDERAIMEYGLYIILNIYLKYVTSALKSQFEYHIFALHKFFQYKFRGMDEQ